MDDSLGYVTLMLAQRIFPFAPPATRRTVPVASISEVTGAAGPSAASMV